MAAFEVTESPLLRDRWLNLVDDGDPERLGIVADANKAWCGTGLLPGLSVRSVVPRNGKPSAFSLAIGLSLRVLSPSLHLRFGRCSESEFIAPPVRAGIVVDRFCDKGRVARLPPPGVPAGVCAGVLENLTREKSKKSDETKVTYIRRLNQFVAIVPRWSSAGIRTIMAAAQLGRVDGFTCDDASDQSAHTLALVALPSLIPHCSTVGALLHQPRVHFLVHHAEITTTAMHASKFQEMRST